MAEHLTVEAAYDRWARHYDTYDNPMVYAAERVLPAALGDLRGAKMFEFGCGTGRNLELARGMGAAWVGGCDLSVGMLEKARARDGGCALSVFDMSKLGAELPVAAGSVDVVLFCLTLEHVADLKAPLREARRILRPGGRVVMVEIHPFLSLSGVEAHFVDEGGLVKMPTVAHQFEDYLRAFAMVGLAVADVKEWRAKEFGPEAPAKVWKRGPEAPLVVEWKLEKRKEQQKRCQIW